MKKVFDDLSLALLHYPVRDKKGKTVATSITNLDLHDISRSCATYGIKNFFVVTKLASQRQIAREMVDYWTRGTGSSWNKDRNKAMSRVKIVSSLEEILEDLGETVIIATSAKENNGGKRFEKIAEIMDNTQGNKLLLFGTGWGLTRGIINKADHILDPIKGEGLYNHLSVRSAAAIILDRLFTIRRSGL